MFVHIRLAVLAAVLCAAAVLSSTAQAAVRFSSWRYSASENQGTVTITVVRDGPLNRVEHVDYGTHKMDSTPGVDYENVSGTLEFAPGEDAVSFTVPIVAHPFAGGLANHFDAFLYGAWPERIGQPDSTVVAINHDEPLDARTPLDPLELTPAPAAGNPLQGARFYVDHWGSAPGVAERAPHTDPTWRAPLDLIASQPEVLMRFGKWDGETPGTGVFRILEKAYLKDPGAVPLLSTYNIAQRTCSNPQGDSPAQVAAYHSWVDGLARGIGNFRAVMFFEQDSLILMPCLTRRAQAVRLGELHYALATFYALCPHLVVYLDGGAGDAATWQDEARLLRGTGLPQFPGFGFFVNATHYDWTTSEIAYGQHIARALSGVHFVVNTARNGRGPLAPPDRATEGNEVLCNPPGRGIGPRPTSQTGYKWADGFFWLQDPGESDGTCRPGAPPSPTYWPWLGVQLARHADFNITGPGRTALLRASNLD